MWQFKGFKTKKEATAFAKSIDGKICYEKSKTESRGKNTQDYKDCVNYGGLSSKKYPYAVLWQWDKAETEI